jgi:hypothetical protein
MRKPIFLLVMAIVFFNILHAQRLYTTNNNLWLAYNGDHKVSKLLGIHLEYQERRSKLGAGNQQNLFRTALNYHFLPNAFASMGYAFVATYPYGNFAVKSVFPEHRIYQQLQYNNGLGIIESVNRFRLEQRFNYLPVLQTDSSYKASNKSTYSNRVRYAQRFSIPLKGKKIVDKSFYITCFDELFINFGEQVQRNIFDQNRAFAGIGYKLPKLGRIELGYLNQLLFKGDEVKVENNNTLSLVWNANFSWL